jgi:LytS/YehU family sensor histidine kinase
MLPRFWAPFLLLPLALIWQSSELSMLPVFGWRLDPTLVLVIAGGLLMGPRYGVFFGLVAGGCQDVLIGAGLLYGFTKAIAGFAAGLIQPHIYRLDALSLGLLAMVWTLVEGLCVAIYLLAHGRTAVWDHFAALALPLGLAHAFLLAVLYYGLLRLPAPETREVA